MSLILALIVTVGVFVIVGGVVVALTGVLLRVPLTTGGTRAELRNIAIVLGALPGGIILLMLSPVLPQPVCQLIVRAFPEPQISGEMTTSRAPSGSAPADDR